MSLVGPHEIDGGFVGPTEVTDPTDVDRICAIRAAVWLETGAAAPDAFPEGRWRDEHDASARHWVVTRDGEIVAAARLSMHPTLEAVPEADEYLRAGLELAGPVAAPARVVVVRSARSHGLAARLAAAQDEAAIAAGATNGVCQTGPAMTHVRGRRGWRLVAQAGSDPRFPGMTFQIMTRAYASDPSSRA